LNSKKNCGVVLGDKNFYYDGVFGPHVNQNDVYDGCCVEEMCQNVIDGYNSTVVTYGQTGSGKTFTMEGFNYDACDSSAKPRIDFNVYEHDMGVMPRAARSLFELAHAVQQQGEIVKVKVSMIQIYNETVYDLLHPRHFSDSVLADKGLRVREDVDRGQFFAENVYQPVVDSYDDLLTQIQYGCKHKIMAAHNMNHCSSRSHCLLSFQIERWIEGQEGSLREASFTLVDLAGSEKNSMTETRGNNFTEAKYINSSLTVFRRVIDAVERGVSHVPYRESKLTSLLRHALGGNSYLTLIACVTPDAADYDDNLTTLRYAQRASRIHNSPIVNIDPRARKIAKLTKKLQKRDEQVARLVTNLRHVLKHVQTEERGIIPNIFLERLKRDNIHKLVLANSGLVNETFSEDDCSSDDSDEDDFVEVSSRKRTSSTRRPQASPRTHSNSGSTRRTHSQTQHSYGPASTNILYGRTRNLNFKFDRLKTQFDVEKN